MKLSSRRDALAFAMALSGLAAGPVLALARGVQFQMSHSATSDIPQVGSPIRLSVIPVQLRIALSQFKQDIHQFLSDWPGFSTEAVDDFDKQVALG